MAKDKEIKTNAMRILDRMKIEYSVISAEISEFISGSEACDKEGIPHECCFKTLLAEGKSGNYHVFMLPVDGEVDMKAAARAAGEKSISLVPVKNITALTGYVRGGVSPLGMKKAYPAYLSKEAEAFDRIYISAGQIGVSVYVATADLLKATRGKIADFTMSV